MIYITTDEIEDFNKLALELLPGKKGDRFELWSYGKIKTTCVRAQIIPGDAYTKAAYYLRSLTKAHAFASGNRRTAMLVTKRFLEQNNKIYKIDDTMDNSKVMIGIREGYYSDDEIKGWLENGCIREFRRS
jgi:prophage maintenance system killer protein